MKYHKTSASIHEFLQHSIICALLSKHGANVLNNCSILEWYKYEILELNNFENWCFTWKIGVDTAENEDPKDPEK